MKRKSEAFNDLKKRLHIREIDDIIQIENNFEMNNIINNKISFFNMENMHKMLHLEKIVEGKHFTINYGSGISSGIFWKNFNNEYQSQIEKSIDLASKYLSIYLPIHNKYIDENLSYYTFNQNCKHYPLDLAIKDLYRNSISYSPLNELNNSIKPNHNLFQAVKLIQGLCNLFIEFENQSYPLPIFDFLPINESDIYELLNENIWIENGNLNDLLGVNFEKIQFFLSPFIIKKYNQKEKEVPIIKNEFMFKIFKRIGTNFSFYSAFFNISSPKKEVKY